MESDTGIMLSFVQCHFPPQDCKQGGDVLQGCTDSILPPDPRGHGRLSVRGRHRLRDPGHKIGKEMGKKKSSPMYGGTWAGGRLDPGEKKGRKDTLG